MAGIVDRRAFLKQATLVGAGVAAPRRAILSEARTRHLIFIVNGGGARKKDYYEDPWIAPNVHAIAREAYVFEEDHCDQIASHTGAFAELMQGHKATACQPASPTIIDYVRKAFREEPTNYWHIGPGRSFDLIPTIMRRFKPRILIFHQDSHDVGHETGGYAQDVTGYEKYMTVVRATDAGIGKIFTWVKNHPYFGTNTAIVIRPEFGRDDEVNRYGELHHSEGFYYTHRVASVFWGPDFNTGVDRQSVIHACDMTPTLTALFGVEATYSEGRVVPGLYR